MSTKIKKIVNKDKTKNALNIYEIAEIDMDYEPTEGDTLEDLKKGEWMRLAVGLTGVEDATDEEVEEVAYMDGDGTAETEVQSVKMGYEFPGQYVDEDPAMSYIRSIESLTGQDRKVIFRVTRVDKSEQPTMVYTQLGTVSEIITSGGDASEYEEFSCKVAFDRKPEIEDLKKK